MGVEAVRDFDLEQYRDWFDFVALERDEAGVLEVRLHRDGGVLTDWGGDTLSEIGLMFGIIGQDPGNRVVILTGTGDWFIRAADVVPEQNAPIPAEGWLHADIWARRLQRNLLNIEVPIVAAVNGPFELHSELAIMSDLIVASDTAWFQDTRHFTVGCVPGDGCMPPWMRLLGPNRGRQFLLQGLKITAAECLERGIVAEVVPRDQVLDRARALAAELATRTTQALRYTRIIGTREYRRNVELDGGYGTALQGLAAGEYWPGGKVGAGDVR